MKKKKVRILSKTGLHARPAAEFVQIANKFDCNISIKKNEDEINAKSIMGVLMLAATQGVELTIIADGKDEDLAIKELHKYIMTIK